MTRVLRAAALIAALIAGAAVPAARAADPGPTVPAGFTIERIASLPGPRELAVTPNGDLLVGTSGASVAIVRDAQGNAQPARAFASFDDRPVAGVALHGDTLFAGGQFGVYRLPYHAGEAAAGAAPEKIASVRTSGQSRDHTTTTVAFSDGTLYASVGSSCNACSPELDATRATIQAMRPDGGGMHPRAVDIRNAIALAVNGENGHLWAGVAGRDELEPGHPYEIFDDVSSHQGTPDYGWLTCYDDGKPIGSASCANVVVPRVVFPAYETPIAASFYPLHPAGRFAFPQRYRGGAFVALHGSWHRPLVAPRVAFVAFRGGEPATRVDWKDPNAQWSEFFGGCQRPDESRVCRPSGVAVGTDGSLFVSDDGAGAIYRIRPATR